MIVLLISFLSDVLCLVRVQIWESISPNNLEILVEGLGAVHKKFRNQGEGSFVQC